MSNKIIIILFFLVLKNTVYAQTTDSVSTNSNTNDVFYSFSNGIVKSMPNNDWDIAFEISGYTASMLVNHTKGLELYQSPYAIAQWNIFDTTGYKNFKKMYNNEYSWGLGAFNRHTDGNFDLGWGTYVPETHAVSGDSLFLLKLADSSFRKIQIINLVSGVYNFKYAKIDGSNSKTSSVVKANFKNKNFAYYTFNGDSTIDREPLTSDWDIMFTKYTAFIPQKYTVSGVLTNKNVKSAEARFVSKNIMNFNDYSFSDTNSVIGYDWKKYNPTLGKYTIADSLVYFIKNAKEQNWKIYFTEYKSGTYYFVKQSLTASIKKASNNNIKIYPNPSQNALSILTSTNIINYQIFDINGKSYLSGTDSKIDTSTLANGIYILKVNTYTGSGIVKFIKE